MADGSGQGLELPALSRRVIAANEIETTQTTTRVSAQIQRQMYTDVDGFSHEVLVSPLAVLFNQLAEAGVLTSA